MNGRRLDVQNIFRARGGHASSLLHDEGHGVALVQQPQLTGMERKSDLATANSVLSLRESGKAHLALGALDVSGV